MPVISLPCRLAAQPQGWATDRRPLSGRPTSARRLTRPAASSHAEGPAAGRLDHPAGPGDLSRRAALVAGVTLPGLALASAAVAADAPAAALVDAAVAVGLPPQADTIDLKGVGPVSALGIGAWSWGDRTGFWGWGSSYGKEDVYGAYRAAMDGGISGE
jgi:hypothetical protein